jgi:hypothetical protein
LRVFQGLPEKREGKGFLEQRVRKALKDCKAFKVCKACRESLVSRGRRDHREEKTIPR